MWQKSTYFYLQVGLVVSGDKAIKTTTQEISLYRASHDTR